MCSLKFYKYNNIRERHIFIFTYLTHPTPLIIITEKKEEEEIKLNLIKFNRWLAFSYYIAISIAHMWKHSSLPLYNVIPHSSG